MIKGNYGQSAQGNFKIVDTIGVPHPYCIGDLHMKYNDTMVMDENSIRNAEKKGAVCCICQKQLGKPLTFDEHKQALLVECKIDIQPPPQELKDYLESIKAECERNGYVGFAFEKAKPEPSPEPAVEKRIKLAHNPNPQRTLKKTLYIGKIPKYDGFHNPDLHVKVQIETKEKKDGHLELSMSGVIGAKSNGDAVGSSGQIDMDFKHRDPKQDDKRSRSLITPDQIQFAPEWDASLWYDLLDVWHKWHLNGMKAACEHQEQLWDLDKEVTIVKYQLKSGLLSSQNKLKDDLIAKLTKEGQATVPEELRKVLELKFWIERPVDSPLPPEIAEYYEEKSRETKKVTSIYPIGALSNTYGGDEHPDGGDEHPDGVLTKPCPVCGYKYGSGWLTRDLPEEVIQFINDLPSASKQPAWI